MYFLLAIFAVASVSAIRGLVRHARYRKLSRAFGCQNPLLYPHLDPLFGLDTFIGSFVATVKSQHVSVFASRFDKCGSIFAMRSPSGTKLFTIDDENLAAMYGTPPSIALAMARQSDSAWPHWGVEPARLTAMEPFCGKGFITTDGDAWQTSRTALKPCFARKNIADPGWYQRLVHDFLETLPVGEAFDLAPLLDDLFLENSFKFLFGHPLSQLSLEFKTTVPTKGFLGAFHAAETGAGIRVMLGNNRWLFPTKKYMANCDMVHRFVDEIIDHELGTHESAGSKPPNSEDPITPNSLVHHLLSQTNDKIEIRGHILQAMMPTSDTTAVLIGNTFFLLSRYPHIWKEFVREVNSLSQEALSFNELRSLKSVYNILSESIRLYPVLPNLGRTALQDTILPRGGGKDGSSPVFVPKGTSCTNSFYALHRNETVFGPGASDFVPARWNSISPGTFEYMPFGGGPRQCLGKEKALVEAAYFLIAMARRFPTIGSRDTREWAGKAKLSARNARGCLIALYDS
ncbi:cytochrome P450 [Lophiostoma macrostomum CBS 122681]|uniref:Cytochrome P450 n=1 Tax=Lophiostoma macrostomum CBS 122681 TaxID=1314788 RepID=A0A6A6SZZ2_9PLEO|nr:cytochrome P450 [Lophiostoma macrostomum CBS 122681]